MNICIIYSPDWLKYIYIEIFALIKTNSDVTNIYLISDAAGEPNSDFCSDLYFKYGIEVIFLDLEALYNDTIRTPSNIGRFTRYTLYRLLIPKVIPEDRILYLDADTIVNGDLSEFYHQDIKNIDIVGVRDIGILDIQLQSIGKKHGDLYINAGVLLMNLDQIREKNLSDTWIKLINTQPTSCYDQDIMNRTCNIKLASNIYNSSMSTGIPPVDQIKIAHYAGHLAEKGWCGIQSQMHTIWRKWEYEYVNSKNNTLLLAGEK